MAQWHYTQCGLDHIIVETEFMADDAGEDVI